MFKVKNKSDIIGFKLCTNKDWDKTNDGFKAFKYYDGYEIAIQPM